MSPPIAAMLRRLLFLFMASATAVGKALYLRTDKALYRIEKP